MHELLLYEWQLPENLEALQNLVQDLLSSRVDAIAFTSQVQIRHLFQIAAKLEKTEELTEALKDNIIVAAVGPVCTAVLEQIGVTPDVEPEHPKMGPMISALARFVEQNEKNDYTISLGRES